ncbi:ABC transporter permease [Fictibacillus nanhaiensis]|uniref:ABC transporter permease n=1 Tax=Fictibacillus nanhaiensis TaxID=742169 RepID=UPI001C9450D4|nr:ABC transporter permease subunit [Fictibacillus nanhaiensis]MBY6037912.1 ABC transporter permease [Fictibacillus nanhaiensis]
MFHKALWMRNQKIGGPAVWAVYLSLFFFMPISFFGSAQNLQSQAEHFADEGMFLNFSFHGRELALFLSFIIVGLATLLIGQERTTHSTDLTFALPFKRKDIFLSKWMFGIVHITTSILLNLLLCMVIVKFTILSEMVDASFLLEFMILVIPFSIAIFTFCLFIGTIAGSMVSQFLLSVIFLWFPIGFFWLIGTFLTYHGVQINEVYDLHDPLHSFGDFMSAATLPIPVYEFSYFTNLDDSVSNSYTNMPNPFVFLSPLLYMIITFPLGIWLFTRSKNENNGRLLVFEKGKGFFSFGVVLCFALAFGMAGGGLFNSNNTPSLIGYYVSAGIGGILSYILLRKIIGLRLSR